MLKRRILEKDKSCGDTGELKSEPVVETEGKQGQSD